MVFKTFWLYVCAIMLYVDGKQNNHLQLFSAISKNKVCYIGMPTIATLVIFSFFVYRLIQKRVHNKVKICSKDDVEKIITLEINDTFIKRFCAGLKLLFCKKDESKLINLCENASYRLATTLNDSIKNNYFKVCSKDIQQYINNFIIINKKKERHKQNFSKEIVTYRMSLLHKNCAEELLYPINFHANSLVKQTFVHANSLVRKTFVGEQTNHDDFIPRAGDRCFIDTQWWVNKNNKKVRLSIDTIAVDYYINCSLPETVVIDNTVTRPGRHMLEDVNDFMMDGKNVNNCVIIGAVSSDKKTSFIFADKINVKYSQKTYLEIHPYSILNGLLLTVMMHPYKDIIAYSFKQERPDQDIEKVPQYKIHIVENAFCEPQGNTITLSSSPINYYSSIDFGIKKITFFGGSTYLFLTLDGQLGMCWSAIDEQNKNIVQWSLKKHKSAYIDFTPDTSVVTSTGFMPNWAFLNDKGEIFLCDFLSSLRQTTLFFVKQARKPQQFLTETFDKIYYKDGHCGVLYKKIHTFGKNVPYTKLILYS